MNVLVSSTTEGSDKPKKYPLVFQDADMIIISKYDLRKHVGFDEKAYLRDLKGINPKAMIVKTSAKDGEAFKEAAHALEHAREHLIRGHHPH